MSTSRRTRFLKYLSAPNAQLIEINTNDMQDRGIHQGDLVLADHDVTPQEGELEIQDQQGKLRIKVSDGKKKGGKVVWVLREV